MNLTLITHIIIAFSGLALTTFAYMRPSKTHLHLAYIFVGLTFATGLYLVAMAPAHMLQACTSGLVYLGLATIGIMATKAKLAHMQLEPVQEHTELK